MNHFTEALGLSRFTLYMQDYGGPVGFRMGFGSSGPDRGSHRPGRGGRTTKVWGRIGKRGARFGPIALPTKARFAQISRWQRPRNAPCRERSNVEPMIRISGPMNRLSQSAWQADIQSDLFYDYRTNVDAYPKWQAWMRDKQPRLLVIWGNTICLFGAFRNRRPIAATCRRPKSTSSMRPLRIDTAADEIAQLLRAL